MIMAACFESLNRTEILKEKDNLHAFACSSGSGGYDGEWKK